VSEPIRDPNTTETKPVSRFRLAKVDTAGLKLPPLATPLDIPVVLGAFAGARPEPAGPELISYAPAPEVIDLATTGFEEELLELARAEAEFEPPAGIQPLLEPAVRLTAIAPPAAEPIDATAAAAMPAGPAPEAEFPLLRAKLVAGPNAKLKASPAVPDAASAQPKPESASAPPEPAKPRITIRPAEPPKAARPDVRRPATIAARGNAAPAIAEEKSEPPQPAKPVVIPIRKPDPMAAPAAKAEPLPAPIIGLGATQTGSGAGMKIAAVAAGLVVVAGAAWFFLRGGTPARVDAASVGSAEVVEPLPALGGAGWASNWGADAPVN
jgi:hypothetical protein